MKPPSGSVANAADVASIETHAPVDADDPEEREDRDQQHGQRDVQEPEPAGDRADAVRHLHLRPGHLRLEELASTDSQARQHGEREHDDAHPAEPAAELAPHEKRLVDRLDVAEDRGARRREARHGLEQRVQRPVELRVAGEDVRQRTVERRQEPGERDDEKAFSEPDAVRGAPQPLQRQADDRRQSPQLRGTARAIPSTRAPRQPGRAPRALRYLSIVPQSARAPRRSTALRGAAGLTALSRRPARASIP